MNLKYDDEGCLLQGIYGLSLDEIEHEFVGGNQKEGMISLKIISVILKK